MNILVTGSKGQLGSEINKIAKNSFFYYFFTDVAELDITDPKALDDYFNDNDINIVINCAAFTNVDKAEDDSDAAELINNKAVGNLAVVCKKHNSLLIHISTDYVFDGQSCLPYTESDFTNPIGIYGKSKLAGEKTIIKSGCDYLIFRTSWLYSSFGNNFVKTIAKLSKEKDFLKVVFDQVGTPTYAADLAQMICKVIEHQQFNDKNQIYHFSNEGVCSWYDFALNIVSLAGNTCNIIPCHSNEFPSKVKRPNFSVLDKTKIKSTFNISIPHWTESLQQCMAILNQKL